MSGEIHEGSHPMSTLLVSRFALLLAATYGLAASAWAQQGSGPAPLIKQDAMQRVSEHVYVILDDNASFVPNVGIVVGDRATLVIDTGLGERNGAIVLEEARKAGDNEQFYLAATHFHPEHDLGATAFPESAKMVRWHPQQDEADELGDETKRRFAGFSPALAELLADAEFRAPDLLFDDAITLDLGGVRVRMSGAGPNHTRGDTVFFVEEDAVLFAGDIVMPHFPAVNGQAGSIDKWLANLDRFEALSPRVVIGAHGRMGDLSLVRRYREYLTAVRDRVAAAKRAGQSADEAVQSLGDALAGEFADLTPANGQAAGRVNGAIQAAYREAR
jgi:glyoxylase-like metal-dependent hydrolase (beta-lactamase superfamily II)